MNARFNFGDAAPFELSGGGRFVLSRKDFVPAYVRAFENGVLQERAAQAMESLRSCRVCPRDCEIDRFNNKIGVCKSGRLARVASAFPHFGEEDCLRGWNGSGTIFFGWCNLRCVFCQNFGTSQLGEGAEVTAAELARMMLDLQRPAATTSTSSRRSTSCRKSSRRLCWPSSADCACRWSITLRPTIAWKASGSWTGWWTFTCPISSCGTPSIVAKYLVARDYADAARDVIAAMHAQVGELKVDEQGLALRGVLVRHLVMPSSAR